MNFAFFSFYTSKTESPGDGTKGIPITWTASPGKAYFKKSPRSSKIALALKHYLPNIKIL